MTKEMSFFGKDVIKQSKCSMDKTRPVFGIDLGTTNSAISVITHGDYPETITLTNGKQTMPSCVMWKDGEFIVGEKAYEHRECANVVYSVKRYMQDVGKKVKFVDGSKVLEMTPAEVSAEILKGLIAQTDGIYGEIKDVIVTVPAYFDQNGRNATRKACELAGLNLLDILNEPTAAALCYNVSDGSDVTEFVAFDFGGGTFDATLARIVTNSTDSALDDIYGIDSKEEECGKTIECLAIEGDSHLGGDDVDRELYRILCHKAQEMGIDTSKFSREYEEELILRLERLKKIDTTGTYGVNVEAPDKDGSSHISKEIMIDRNDFYKSLRPSYKKCKRILDKLLRQRPNNADRIVLVGGSTKNPLLVEMLKKDYPEFVISDSVNQDLAVTLGASIKGKITKFGSDSVKVFDILPMTIGVLDDGRVTPILCSGNVLPATDSMVLTTVADNQRRMRLKVLQGNSPDPAECVLLGELVFEDIPEAPAGEVNLSVTIMVTASSIMKCTGMVNGVKKDLTLNLTGDTQSEAKKLTRDEKLITRWRRCADKMDGEAKKDLNRMIDAYPNMFSRKDIMLFIKEHTEGVVRQP